MQPIQDIADKAGILEDELELYGRYKAKIDYMALLERLKDKPDGKIIDVTAITPTPLGEGKTVTAIGLTRGHDADRQEHHARPARALAGPGVRHQGRRRRRRLLAAHPHGGPQPALHRRHPRRGRGQQPARRHDRLPSDARQRARHRSAQHLLAPRASISTTAPCARSSTAWAASSTACPRETGYDITVASEVMAILGLATSLKDLRERLGRITFGYTNAGKPLTAEDIKAGRRHGRAAQGRDQAEPDADPGGQRRAWCTPARSPTSPRATTPSSPTRSP